MSALTAVLVGAAVALVVVAVPLAALCAGYRRRCRSLAGRVNRQTIRIANLKDEAYGASLKSARRGQQLDAAGLPAFGSDWIGRTPWRGDGS